MIEYFPKNEIELADIWLFTKCPSYIHLPKDFSWKNFNNLPILKMYGVYVMPPNPLQESIFKSLGLE